MMYDYDRKTARVPGEFPDTGYDRFRKNLNSTIQAAGEIIKSLQRDRWPNKVKAAQAVLKELLELREDMLWISTAKGDEVRVR